MENKVIQETMKKSELAAKDLYDYKRIICTESYLVPAELKEEKEELIFTYKIGNWMSVSEVRKEDILEVLLVLESIGGLQEGRRKYSFSLRPENIYYDQHGNVKVKQRDVHMQGDMYDEDSFLNEYKSVIGFSLQKKYGYEDFLNGGIQLLGKEGLAGEIKDKETVEEIRESIHNYYIKVKDDRIKTKILLPKKNYTAAKITAIILGVLLLGTAGFLGYHMIFKEPYKDAVIKLSDAYASSDYVACIDSMEKISVEKMNLFQKYMLANAYVRSENLTQEQKGNILEKMTLKDSASKLEYWIHLGRKDTEKAEDIALRQSDDQLLLYAYMKEKANIEDNTKLSGSEKSQKLDEITKKMEPLMEKYKTKGK